MLNRPGLQSLGESTSWRQYFNQQNSTDNWTIFSWQTKHVNLVKDAGFYHAMAKLCIRYECYLIFSGSNWIFLAQLHLSDWKIPGTKKWGWTDLYCTIVSAWQSSVVDLHHFMVIIIWQWDTFCEVVNLCIHFSIKHQVFQFTGQFSVIL